jgi:hypothetical protein
MDNLEKESDYFRKLMTDDLRQFGADGKISPLKDEELTSVGLKVMKIAEVKIGEWLYLNPVKLRTFIRRHLYWNDMEEQVKESKVMDLIDQMKEGDEAKIRALAQMLMRVTEYSRDRYNSVNNAFIHFNEWYEDQGLTKLEDNYLDLGSTRINKIVNSLVIEFNAFKNQLNPTWLTLANILTELLKIASTVAIVESYYKQVDKNLQQMKLMANKVMDTLMKIQLAHKVAKVTKTESSSNISTITNQIQKDDNINGQWKEKKFLKPRNYKENFQNLAKDLGYDEREIHKLSILLREVYTNPLVYLGPPRNLKEDRNTISRPLVVSRMSWKERRKRMKYKEDELEIKRKSSKQKLLDRKLTKEQDANEMEISTMSKNS